MEKLELFKTFTEHLDAYAQLRGFIDKARAQQGKFSGATIERVVIKNEIKSQDEAEAMLPLVPQLQQLVTELSADIDRLDQRKSSAGEEMEELELRKIIGELSDEEFEAEAASFQSELDETEGRISALAEERDTYSDALDRWVELAIGAGHDTGLQEDAGEEPGEVHAQAAGMREDVSALFPQAAPAAAPATAQVDLNNEFGAEEDDEDFPVAIEAAEESDLDGAEGLEISMDVGIEEEEEEEEDDGAVEMDMSVEADEEEPEISIQVGSPALQEETRDEDEDDFGFEGDDEGMDLLGGDAEEEVEVDLGGDAGDMGLGFDDEEDGQAASSGAQRRALLIYQEGTAEEQIYPFTADQLTIGRGRDNHIQIKNDSKVSRYHCKVFRRGDNFYIEDNKSSNGSLVNGELVTERRLFGGEEIIIGETFFRFRIME